MVKAGPDWREPGPQGGGTIPGGDGAPAFSLTAGDTMPVVLAVPHAGRAYPSPLLAQLRHPAEATLRLEDRCVDLLAQAVARETGAALLIAHAPRAMIDLNRAPDDVDWDMVTGDKPPRRTDLAAGRRARSGLGLVPRRLPAMGELWRQRLDAGELEARIVGVHQAYHAILGRTLERVRDRWGAALLVDLHSMPPLGPKRGPDAAPDFVVGDRFGSTCDPALSAAALAALGAEGYRAAHNRPYAGGYALDRHGAPSRGIHALQVEVCRTAYLDSRLREPSARMADIAAVLAAVLRTLAGELSASPNLSQAAE